MRHILLAGIVFIGMLYGCRSQADTKAPAGIIPRDSMISLMAAIELNEAALKIQQTNINRDSLNKLSVRSYDSVYSYYRSSPQRFKISLDYYQNNLDDFQKMIDEVILRLIQQRDSLQHH